MQVKKEAIRTMRCPFDPNHIMPYERFLNHIEKCSFPEKKSYRKCKFNPYHIHHMDLIASHENSCPDRKKFEVDDDDDWGAADEVFQPQQVPESYSKIEKSVASTSFDTDAASELRAPDFSSVQSEKRTTKKGKEQKKYSNMEVHDLEEWTQTHSLNKKK